jgi:membrane-associated protease RseP (regulator of RpoE activity)
VLYTLGVLLFAVGLLASIALHEIGHLVPAKKFGVRVTQYMVGFGPTLWSKAKGGTEYGVKAVPLGGYIRMIGMVPPPVDGKVSRWPRRMATAIEDFRSTSRSEVRAEDGDNQFYRLTPGKKMIVMLGGPSMNFVIYLVLTLVLLTTLGMKESTNKVESVSQCVVAANSPTAASGTCTSADAPAPANGVLKAGDVIKGIDGQPYSSWDKAVSVIEKSAGKPLSLLISRDGVDQTVTVTPVENVKYANAQGTKTKTAGFIGIAPTQAYVPLTVSQVPGQIGDQLSQALSALGNYPSKISNLFGTIFEGKPRDPNGAIGVVGIGRLGGEVADSHFLDVQDKVFLLVSLLASVNLLLFFFNLLPLLPLDGGHVAGAIVEAAKRGRARLRERSMALARTGAPAANHDPFTGEAMPASERRSRQIFVDTAQMLPVMYAVASILGVLTLLIVYADIVNPVTLGG